MKNGTPHIPKGQRNSAERCKLYYVKTMESGCWVWTGKIAKNGYGCVTFDYKSMGAHKFFYEQTKGAVPKGLHLDHLCRNKACVNPDHLEPVTCRTNTVERGRGPSAINARKVVCLRGHPLSGDNVYLTKKGQRYCKTCSRARGKEHLARKRAHG